MGHYLKDLATTAARMATTVNNRCEHCRTQTLCSPNWFDTVRRCIRGHGLLWCKCLMFSKAWDGMGKWRHCQAEGMQLFGHRRDHVLSVVPLRPQFGALYGQAYLGSLWGQPAKSWQSLSAGSRSLMFFGGSWAWCLLTQFKAMEIRLRDRRLYTTLQFEASWLLPFLHFFFWVRIFQAFWCVARSGATCASLATTKRIVQCSTSAPDSQPLKPSSASEAELIW